MKDNEQNIIDTTARQALENLEMPYNADHWQAMADKLGALDASDTEFDKNVSDKLRGIEKSYNADHWQIMADKLDALDARDTEFDNNVGDKLRGIEVPFVASNWADMSERLDDLDDSDTTFDALFNQRLENLQVKYQPKHWNFMAQQIEETFSWRAKIVRYKLVEVALVLLTLFTVGNMLDLPFDSDYSTSDNTGLKGEKTIKGKDKNLKKVTPENAKKTKFFYNPLDWRTRPTVSKDIKAEQNTSNKPIAETNNILFDTTSNPLVVQLSKNIEKELLNDALNNKTNVAAPSVRSSPNSVAQLRENTEGTTFDKLPMKKVSALGKVRDNQPLENQTDVVSISKVLHPVDKLKPSPLNTHFFDEHVTFPIFVEKRAKWRLNIFGLPIADMVSYNYVKSRTKETEHQIASNLGAGVAFGYKKNKWEIETGLTYLDKKYNLPNVEVTTGSFLRGLKTEKPLSVRLSIISMPLSINYTFKETYRWRFYARLGAALNTILKSKEEIFVETSNSISSANGPNTSNNLGQYEPNVYPKGILEKGFFKDLVWLNGGLRKNTYLIANAGIGIEYRFTNKTDIYLQPTYDYHFSKRGIGTLDDRINSFSFQGGVKIRLK